MSDKATYWFEKGMAVIFLLLLIGMILFFNYVPVEAESNNVIMVILGVVLAMAKDSIPRIFGVQEQEQIELTNRIRQLEHQVSDLMLQNQTLKDEYDKILKVLIDNYVVTHPSTVKQGDDND